MTHLGSRSSPIYFITNSQRSLPNLELGQIEFCFFREVRMAIALVTGTSSGIGLATAVSLARGGHTVIATMRNLNGAGELRKIVSEEKLYQRPRRLTHVGDSLAPDFLTPLAREDSRHAISGQIARGLFGGGAARAGPPVEERQPEPPASLVGRG